MTAPTDDLVDSSRALDVSVDDDGLVWVRATWWTDQPVDDDPTGQEEGRP